MEDLDIVVVGYRSEPFISLLFRDLKEMTRSPFYIHYFDNSGNPKTLPAAWNDLAAGGNAKYLAILNPDIAPSPNWDRRLIGCLSSNPEVGIATADPSPFALERPDRSTMERLSQERAGRSDVGRDPVQFFAAMMTRSSWSTLKGVDERMRFYMQDIDLIVRMKERLRKDTVRVFSCPIWHSGSASTRKAKELKEMDPQVECDFGSAVFDHVRRGRMKEWDQLSAQERAQIRTIQAYARIPK